MSSRHLNVDLCGATVATNSVCEEHKTILRHLIGRVDFEHRGRAGWRFVNVADGNYTSRPLAQFNQLASAHELLFSALRDAHDDNVLF